MSKKGSMRSRKPAPKKKPTVKARTRARTTKPKERPLPGLEDVRIKELDDIADSVSECRQNMNELRSEEADLEKRALRSMQKHKKISWRHAGVEFVRVPGEEKLRVRNSKANATAESEPEPASPSNLMNERHDVEGPENEPVEGEEAL